MGHPEQHRDSYTNASLGRGMLARTAPNRDARLFASDMLELLEAARAVGASPSEIRRWVTQARLIGIRDKSNSLRLPKWQFDLEVWPWIEQVADALETRSGWVLLTFFETPLGALSGRTPRQALEQGEPSQVLQAAAWSE